MRKPTYAEAYMYKNILWLSVAVFAFIPFLNNFLLQFLYLYTEGDIAYGVLGTVISGVKSVLSVLSVYIGLGVLTVSVINFGKNAVGVIRLAFISHAVTFLSSVVTCMLYSYVTYGYAVSEDVLMQILLLTVDAVVNLAVCLAIYVALRLISKKRQTVLNVPPLKGRYTDISHPLVFSDVIAVAIHFGVQLLTVLYNMITAFVDPSIGPPVNASDVIYWVLQYLSVIALAALALVAVEAVFLLSEHYVRSGERKRRAVSFQSEI